MKNIPPKKEFTEAELVRNLRDVRSLRTFAAYLNDGIPQGAPGRIAFASVWQWENEIHFVGPASLWAWKTHYPEGDPRHQLALDITALRHKYEPEFSASDKKKLASAVIPKITKETVKA